MQIKTGRLGWLLSKKKKKDMERKLVKYKQKNETGPISHTIHKNSNWIKDLKRET